MEGSEGRKYSSATLDADPVAGTVLKLMGDKAEWEGQPTELLEQLAKVADEEVTRRRSWPANAAVMTKRLKELAPAIREAGLEVELEGHQGRGSGKKRNASLFWVAGNPGDDGDAGDGDQ